MANQLTRYEIVLESTARTRYLLGYTAQHSGAGILAFLRKHPSVWGAVVSYAPPGSFIQKTGKEWQITNPDKEPVARLRFTGRTERDCENTFAREYLNVFLAQNPVRS